MPVWLSRLISHVRNGKNSKATHDTDHSIDDGDSGNVQRQDVLSKSCPDVLCVAEEPQQDDTPISLSEFLAESALQSNYKTMYLEFGLRDSLEITRFRQERNQVNDDVSFNKENGTNLHAHDDAEIILSGMDKFSLNDMQADYFGHGDNIDACHESETAAEPNLCAITVSHSAKASGRPSVVTRAIALPAFAAKT